MNRIKRSYIVDKLIDDDVNTIMSGDNGDYLYNILNLGFVGYDRMSNEELAGEYKERFDPPEDFIVV